MNHWHTSTLIFSLIINLVCFKLFIETRQWNLISIIAGALSIIFYYLVLLVMSTDKISGLFQYELNGMFNSLLKLPKFWILVFAHPALCLIPDFMINAINGLYYPNPSQIIMLQQLKNPEFNYLQSHRDKIEEHIHERKLTVLADKKIKEDSDVSLSDAESLSESGSDEEEKAKEREKLNRKRAAEQKKSKKHAKKKLQKEPSLDNSIQQSDDELLNSKRLVN